MASAERTHVLVRMPADLKRRLADEVARTKQNLNDIAVGILASRFAVPFAGSGRPGSPPKGSGDVLLRMPPPAQGKGCAARKGAAPHDQRPDRRGARRATRIPKKGNDGFDQRKAPQE